MSAFSVENPHDGKMFENYTRFEWGVEVGVVTIFILRLFVPHEFDMNSTKQGPRGKKDKKKKWIGTLSPQSLHERAPFPCCLSLKCNE